MIEFKNDKIVMEDIEYKTDLLSNGVTRISAVDKNGKIVGSAFVGDDGEGNNFGPIQVNPTHRGHGIGKKLVTKTGELLGDQIVGKFRPDTGMEKEVEKFYKSQGFKIVNGRAIK